MSNTNALREEAPAEPLAETAPAETFEVVRPAKLVTPLVVASPHSGNDYTRSFLDLAKLDHATLRLSEDCYVDELVGTAPGHGVPLLKALFPRTYVDANREALELDPLPKVIWMQLTVRNDEAAANAEAAGIKVVMNRCPKIEYGRLSGEIGWTGVSSGVISSKRPIMRQGFQSFGIRQK